MEELAFDGAPFTVTTWLRPDPRPDAASVAIPRGGDALGDIIEQVHRAHLAVLDTHQSIQDWLLAWTSGRAGPAGHVEPHLAATGHRRPVSTAGEPRMPSPSTSHVPQVDHNVPEQVSAQAILDLAA